jgi:phosphoribosyl 1,2-cyclic phosphate phosphodiesterase
MKGNLKITVLGSGTSSGVPTISCDCPTCTSNDPKDKRLRCSLLIENGDTSFVIDTSTDFRQQMLRAKVKKLDAIVFTHHHFDHIGGFDDIRAFNYTSHKAVPIYLNIKTYKELYRTFIYAFEKPEQLGGGVPLIEINIIDKQPFLIKDIEITPIPLMHGKMEVLGYRIGNFAYCTDTNFIPESSYELLKGLDVLILGALRYKTHPTHFNLEEAITAADRIGAKQTYLTHIAHKIKHSDCQKELPKNISLAYDDLELDLII